MQARVVLHRDARQRGRGPERDENDRSGTKRGGLLKLTRVVGLVERGEVGIARNVIWLPTIYGPGCYTND
jgi:hypothetical protein